MIEKTRQPPHFDEAHLGLVVLGVAIVLATFSFRTAINEANHIRGDVLGDVHPARKGP